MGRGRHHSLPKYLRTVFLALGPEPRPLGQALTASISLVSLRQAGPGHREGKLEEAGAWLTLQGGWEMQRTVACLLILPQPTRQQESGCIPKAHGLLSEERLESWGREGGLPGSQNGGGRVSLVLLPQIIQPPKSRDSPEPG